MSNVLDYGVNGSFPSKVGGLGTTVKYFPRPLGPSIGVAPLTPSSTSAVGALILPAANVFNGQLFNVLAGGSFGSDTGDPSGTVTIQLFAVTGTLASPTYTALASTGAITPTYAAAYGWALDVTLVGDNNSGVLGGYYDAIARGILVNSSHKVTDAVISGLNFNTGNVGLGQGAVMGFVVGATFGTSDATNTASLFEFTIES
ncbi:Uncharacterised protein [uncultured archaeon]|nr:Uncharacterised protein [uncultured archaeon]